MEVTALLEPGGQGQAVEPRRRDVAEGEIAGSHRQVGRAPLEQSGMGAFEPIDRDLPVTHPCSRAPKVNAEIVRREPLHRHPGG